MERQASVIKPLVSRLDGADRYKRLLAGVPQTRGMKSGYVTLKPGENVGEHVTEGREEVLVVLHGEGDLLMRGAPSLKISGGTAAYVPPETPHDVCNTGSGILRYVYVTAPILPAEPA